MRKELERGSQGAIAGAATTKSEVLIKCRRLVRGVEYGDWGEGDCR